MAEWAAAEVSTVEEWEWAVEVFMVEWAAEWVEAFTGAEEAVAGIGKPVHHRF
jgi:hypothetical protein